MLSSMSTTSFAHSRHGQSVLGKNYATGQVPRVFSGRALKAPTLPFSHTTSKFDGYHTAPPAEQRQSHNWYPPRTRDTFGSYPASSEVSKTATLHRNESSTAARQNYNSSSKSTAPSYSFYAAGNDVFVYEQSPSSKSDIYSNTDYDGVSITTFSPSSAFSPAMSTDSTMALRSPMTTESGLDSRSSTPTQTRNTTPVLLHAQSAFRDALRSQSAHATSSALPSHSFLPHAPSSRPSALSGSTDESRFRAASPPGQGRSTPTRLSGVSTGAEARGVNQVSELHTTPASMNYTSQSYPPSMVSESDDDLHRLARANAEYNAASSAYYPSSVDSRESRNPDSASATATTTAAEPRQIYSNLSLRNSPEQQYRAPSIYRVPGDTSQTDTIRASTDPPESRARSRPMYNHESQSDGRSSVQSEEFLPPLPHLDQEPVTASRPLPIRRQSEHRAISEIPEIRNEGHRDLSRYVPASHTMMPNISARSTGSSSDSQSSSRESDRRQDRALPIPPPLSKQPSLPMERHTSLSQPHPVSQGMAILSNSEDGRTTAPLSLSQRSSSQRERSISFSQSQTYPIAQGFPTPHNGNTVSQASEQVGEREGETLRRSPQGQRPMPGSSYSSRDPGLYRDQQPRPSSGVSIPILPTTAVLSSSPDQMTDKDTRRNPYIAEPPRHRHDPRRQSSTATDPSVHADNSLTTLKSPPEEMTDGSVRRKLPIPNTGALHDSRQAQHSDDSRPPLAVAPALPSHSRSQQPPAPESVPPPSQPLPSVPRTHQHTSPERRRSADTASVIVGGDLPSTRHSSALSVPSVLVTDSGGTSSQLQISYNYERHAADAAINSQHSGQAGYHDSFHDRERRKTQHRDSSSSRNEPSHRSSSNSRQLEENSASERHGTRVSSKTDIQDAPRSHTPFAEPLRHISEPQRRHSDGERPASNEFLPRMAPPYASSDPSNNATSRNVGASRASPTISLPEPQRRFSDGDQAPNISGRNSVLCRSVRWNENLICASPIWPSQRRKGWFNRRGDQLWTNEGAYRPTLPGQEFPLDLADYPDYGQGWMNEEGVRIDMGHRLIPKVPLRSALKHTRT